MYNCWYEKFVNYSWGFPVYGYTLHPNQSLVWSEQNISPMWYVLKICLRCSQGQQKTIPENEIKCGKCNCI